MENPRIEEEFEVRYSVSNKIGEIDFATKVERERDRYFAKRWVYPSIEFEVIGNLKGYDIFEDADSIAREAANKVLKERE